MACIHRVRPPGILCRVNVDCRRRRRLTMLRPALADREPTHPRDIRPQSTKVTVTAHRGQSRLSARREATFVTVFSDDEPDVLVRSFVAGDESALEAVYRRYS